MQTLHRVRGQLLGERTALTNQICAVLLERGHVTPQGRAKLAACLAALLDTDAGTSLTPRMRTLVAEVYERWQDLDRRIAALDAEFAELARTDADTRRRTTISGIGALNATALVAVIGDVATFACGRDLSAWLGLVPRQVTTGGKPKARRHHQARQQVPAQDADLRGPGRDADAPAERHAARSLAAHAAGAGACQHGGRRPAGPAFERVESDRPPSLRLSETRGARGASSVYQVWVAACGTRGSLRLPASSTAPRHAFHVTGDRGGARLPSARPGGSPPAAEEVTMGFQINGSVIRTADGREVGRFVGGRATIELTATGDVADVVKFLQAVGAAYEAIHPPAERLAVDLDEQGDTEWPGVQRLDERTVKAGGERIRVHKSDADHWPSDLHGHVLDRPRTKVDAYDGGIYDTGTRQRIGTMGKKDLRKLQDGLRQDDWARTKLDARQGAAGPGSDGR